MATWRSLIAVLMDRNARWDERDDAAMDLADHDEAEVVDALRRVADDPTESADLRETCGESLRETQVAPPASSTRVYRARRR